MGLTPRSGLLLPTRTTIVAFRPLAANVISHVREEVIVESEMTISSKMSAKSVLYSRLCQLTTAALAKVNPDQLDHVGLQEVDIPPGTLLHLRQGAGAQVEEGASAPVHGLLGDPTLRHTALHRSLASSHI